MILVRVDDGVLLGRCLVAPQRECLALNPHPDHQFHYWMYTQANALRQLFTKVKMENRPKCPSTEEG